MIKRALKIILIIILIPALIFGIYELNFWNLIPKKSYTADDFKIQTIKSSTDYNKNGIDDYTDILIGARNYMNTNPHYKSEYYDGGYPPDGIGVCTDVIWKAFENAGYCLKDMIDEDIEKNTSAYTFIDKPDKNIDFRRVKNLNIFFKRKAITLTTDLKKIEEFQPGDIVIFPEHIAIVSDKRNKAGEPYIIHNAAQPVKEEDAIKRQKLLAHYRWK